MDADGANPRNLTNHDAQDQTPDWSPDGNRIAFSSNRDRNWEIYVMNADGTNPINITNHPAKDGRPDWSPDGQQIAFSSDRDGNLEIYAMNADGTNPINLTNHLAADNRSSWSLDGTRIAFESYRDKNWEIYVMNADGTNPINLTQHPNIDLNPSWGPAPTLSVASTGDWRPYGGKSSAPTPTKSDKICEVLSIKEENHESLIAEPTEADMLPLYRIFGSCCEPSLGINKPCTTC